jgi:hypothetical protein
MFFSSDIYSIDSSAVIGLSQLIYGKIPQSQSAFDTLKSAVSLQESSLIGRSVADSDLFGYETLGKTLGETAEGRAKFGGGTDAEFVQRIYKEIFGRDPGQDQVDHFVGQITSFKALYTAAGLSETTIDFGSRGAIAGQIMGSGILDGRRPTPPACSTSSTLARSLASNSASRWNPTLSLRRAAVAVVAAVASRLPRLTSSPR